MAIKQRDQWILWLHLQLLRSIRIRNGRADTSKCFGIRGNYLLYTIAGLPDGKAKGWKKRNAPFQGRQANDAIVGGAQLMFILSKTRLWSQESGQIFRYAFNLWLTNPAGWINVVFNNTRHASPLEAHLGGFFVTQALPMLKKEIAGIWIEFLSYCLIAFAPMLFQATKRF